MMYEKRHLETGKNSKNATKEKKKKAHDEVTSLLGPVRSLVGGRPRAKPRHTCRHPQGETSEDVRGPSDVISHLLAVNRAARPMTTFAGTGHTLPMGPPDGRLVTTPGAKTPLFMYRGTDKGARRLLQGVRRQPWESENITQKSLCTDERACDTRRGAESSETTCSQPGTTRDTAYHGCAPLQRTVHQRPSSPCPGALPRCVDTEWATCGGHAPR